MLTDFRGASLLVFFLSACGSPNPAEIATHTRHCGSVAVSPRANVRLSLYPRGDSTAWLLQACGPRTTACTPLVSYSSAPPPTISLEANTLEVAILGGVGIDVHTQTFKTSGEVVNLVITDVSDEVVEDQYFSNLGIPKGTPDFCSAWAQRS